VAVWVRLASWALSSSACLCAKLAVLCMQDGARSNLRRVAWLSQSAGCALYAAE
jgi:hypothetical protein